MKNRATAPPPLAPDMWMMNKSSRIASAVNANLVERAHTSSLRQFGQVMVGGACSNVICSAHTGQIAVLAIVSALRRSYANLRLTDGTRASVSFVLMPAPDKRAYRKLRLNVRLRDLSGAGLTIMI